MPRVETDIANNFRTKTATNPQCEEALRWHGWGTALKPAWEPIVLAMKPTEGTLADNAIRHGVAGLNIDGCRMVAEKDYKDGGPRFTQGAMPQMGGHQTRPWVQKRLGEGRPVKVTRAHDLGRWPANLLLDEGAAAMLDEQSGHLKGIGLTGKCGGGQACTGNPVVFAGSYHPKSRWDSIVDNEGGGASRFFYTAKASTDEREAALRGHLACIGCGRRSSNRHVLRLSGGRRQTFPLDESPIAEREITEAWATWKAKGCKGPPPKWAVVTCRRNGHPTVKPLSLMRWLCRLVTSPGGTILDPFAGSGTTGVAAIQEGFRFIGIDKDPASLAIARWRLRHAQARTSGRKRMAAPAPRRAQLEKLAGG